jgi:hypothetical protein
MATVAALLTGDDLHSYLVAWIHRLGGWLRVAYPREGLPDLG